MSSEGKAFLTYWVGALPQHESRLEELREEKTEAARLKEESHRLCADVAAQRASAESAMDEQKKLRQRLTDVTLCFAGYANLADRAEQGAALCADRRAELEEEQKAFLDVLAARGRILSLWHTVHGFERIVHNTVAANVGLRRTDLHAAAAAAAAAATSPEALRELRVACDASLARDEAGYDPLLNEWMAVRMAGEEVLLDTRLLAARARDAEGRAATLTARAAAAEEEATSAEAAAARAERQRAVGAATAAEVCGNLSTLSAQLHAAREERAAAGDAASAAGAAVDERAAAAAAAAAALEDGATARRHAAARGRLAAADAGLWRALATATATAEAQAAVRLQTAGAARQCAEAEHQAQTLQTQLDEATSASQGSGGRRRILEAMLHVLEDESARRAETAAEAAEAAEALWASDLAARRALPLPPPPKAQSRPASAAASVPRQLPQDCDLDSHHSEDVRAKTPRRDGASKPRSSRHGSGSREPPRKRMLSVDDSRSGRPAKSPRQSQRAGAFGSLFAAASRPESGGRGGGDALSDISSLFRENPVAHQAPRAPTLRKKRNGFAGL